MESTEPGEEGALRLKTDGVNLQVIDVNNSTFMMYYRSFKAKRLCT